MQAEGDLQVDAHHTVEDVGIVIGQALEKDWRISAASTATAGPSCPWTKRWPRWPLICPAGRRSSITCNYSGGTIGNFPVELVEEFFKAIANNAKMNLHINVPYGGNNHHIAEAIFKATAKALRQAVSLDPRNNDVPSTKGTL